jgi:hypothetical protein
MSLIDYQVIVNFIEFMYISSPESGVIQNELHHFQLINKLIKSLDMYLSTRASSDLQRSF